MNALALKKYITFGKGKTFAMLRLPKNAVLLIIDVQKGFDESIWGKRNNLQAEENIAQLLEGWRETERPVFHVQHLSLSPNSPLREAHSGSEIKDSVKPIAGEHLFQKHVNSAFIGTDLEKKLREYGYDTVVVVGLTTPHCVSTTTRMAGNLSFQTYILDVRSNLRIKARFDIPRLC